MQWGTNYIFVPTAPLWPEAPPRTHTEQAPAIYVNTTLSTVYRQEVILGQLSCQFRCTIYVLVLALERQLVKFVKCFLYPVFSHIRGIPFDIQGGKVFLQKQKRTTVLMRKNQHKKP
jgi:hypothetical protein